jgi:hypothetical protein
VRAVAMGEFGGPEVLRLQEVEDPVLGPDQVLVAVAYAGISSSRRRSAQVAVPPCGNGRPSRGSRATASAVASSRPDRGPTRDS